MNAMKKVLEVAYPHPREVASLAMPMNSAQRILPYVVVAPMVVLVLGAVALIQSAVGTLGLAPLLYLVPITLAAARWGRGPAILACILSVIGHDVLFVEPVGTLTISRADEAVGLVLLSLTAVVIAHLANEARRGAQQAQEAEVVRRSDELKTALLRSVSHDLRTPLASIKASVSSLRQTEAHYTEDDRGELLAAIEDETDRLNRILGNLLEVSRLEAGAVTPHKRDEDLGELTHSVLQRFGPLLEGRQVTVDIPEGLPLVPCDYVQIDQVLSNLIENALRHTPSGSPIHLDLAQDHGAVLARVIDQGPGVAQQDKERVFRPFERGRTGVTGTGLGLAIAKGLIEAHGGRLWVEEAPRGGACFSFTLPLARVEA